MHLHRSIAGIRYVAVVSLWLALGCAASADITIPTVPIGNLGNAPDPQTGFGSVAYAYSIATTEVTNAQYTAFLNAVAATDTNNLYNPLMAGAHGGITRANSPGSYTYAVVSGRASNPVNWVSFWDACRFANWLHNGQPSGAQSNATTEDGAYTLTNGGITANTVTRNAGWQWAVTSENEWYKAAYHQPASQGGDFDDYWLYPMSNNLALITQANFGNAIGDTTPVGSYPANFYGTYDMGGNIWEWNEAMVFSNTRGLRGGQFLNNASLMNSVTRGSDLPSTEFEQYGFRVVAVPTPSSVALLAVGGLVAGRRRRG